MVPVYTHYLTPADYGVLEILTLVSVILSMILSVRLESAVVRFYFEYNDTEDRNSLISTVLIFVCAIAICLSVLYKR